MSPTVSRLYIFGILNEISDSKFKSKRKIGHTHLQKNEGNLWSKKMTLNLWKNLICVTLVHTIYMFLPLWGCHTEAILQFSEHFSLCQNMLCDMRNIIRNNMRVFWSLSAKRSAGKIKKIMTNKSSPNWGWRYPENGGRYSQPSCDYVFDFFSFASDSAFAIPKIIHFWLNIIFWSRYWPPKLESRFLGPPYPLRSATG